jgi:hypothetical protein
LLSISKKWAKNGDRLHFFGRKNIPAASKGFAFASLLTQASIASRCQFRSAGEERLEEREEQKDVHRSPSTPSEKSMRS